MMEDYKGMVEFFNDKRDQSSKRSMGIQLPLAVSGKPEHAVDGRKRSRHLPETAFLFPLPNPKRVHRCGAR